MSKNNISALLQEFMGTLEKKAGEETGSEKAVSDGGRGSENSSDVKASVPGTSVDAAAPVKASHPGAGTNSPLTGRGTNQGETGTNVPSTKDNYTDPGTSHPAKTASLNDILTSANDTLASILVLSKTASVKQAAAAVPATPGSPVATTTAAATGAKPVAAKAPGAVKPQGEVKVAEAVETPVATDDDKVTLSKAEHEELQKAAAFVEEIAGYLTGQQVANEVVKEASVDSDADFRKLAESEVANFLSLADQHSDNLVHTLLGAVKQANDLAAAGAIDPSAMAGMEGGGEQGGGGMEAMMSDMGEGGEPGAEAGAADPQTIQAIVEALHQAGISVEDLAAAESAAAGAGGGEAVAAPSAEAGAGENAQDDKVDAARAASVGAEDGSNEEKTAAVREKFAQFAVKFVKAANAKNSNKAKK